MNQPPLHDRDIPASGVGCGCMLPGAGVVLLVLTIVLGMLLANRRDAPPVLWAVFVLLIVAIVALYFRVQRFRGPR